MRFTSLPAGHRAPRLLVYLAAAALVASAGPALAAEAKETKATDDYNMAVWLYGSKKYDLAAEEFEAFLAKHPSHEKAPDARLGLARALLHQKKPDEAIAALETLRKSHPAFKQMPVVLYHLGQACAAAEGKGKQAAAAFDELVTKYSDHYLATWTRARLGEMRLALGDAEAAEQALAPLVERFLTGKKAEQTLKAEQERLGREAPHVARQLEPLLRRAHVNLGIARLRAERFDAARQTFEEFLALAKKSELAETARFYLAQSLYRAGEFERAADAYDDVAKNRKSPLAADAAFEKALALYQAKKYTSAAKAFRLVGQQFKDSPHAAKSQLYEGICYYLDEEYDRAVARLKGLDSSAEAQYWLGKAYLNRDKPAEALAAFEKAAQADPDGARAADALLGRADALLAQQQYDEAAQAYQAFASKFGQHADLARALYAAAASLYRAGKAAESEAFCERFLATSPEHDLAPRVVFISGENRFLQKQYAAAAERYEQLIRNHADSGDLSSARFRLAWIRYFDEQYDGALALLEDVDSDKVEPAVAAETAYLRGNCLMELDRCEEAADAFKAYLDSKHAERYRDDALLKRGLASKKADDTGAAIEAFRGLLAKHGDSPLAPEAEYPLARILAGEQPDLAASHFRHVADAYPDHRLAPYALSGLGDLEAARDNASAAIEAYGRLAEKYAESDLAPRALYRKATLLAKAERHAEARAAFEQVVSRWSAHDLADDALLGQGLALEAEKQFEPAAGVFRRLLAKTDDAETREQAAYELAWCLQQAGKDAEATKAYQALADRYPASPLAADAFFYLAEIPYGKKEYDAAVPLYQKALAAGDERLKDKVLYRLGWCRWQQKQYPEAAALFVRLIEEVPESDLVPEALLQAGEAYARAGKPAEAVARLKTLMDPKHKGFEHAAEARFRLGECQALLGRHEEALRTFTELAKAYPKYPGLAKVKLGLGKALYDLKRYDPARKRFVEVLEATDTETAAQAQFYIGETYLAEGEPRDALKAYLRVVALWAGYAEWAAAAQFEIGKCYQALGQADEARKAFQTVVDKYAKTKWAEPARKQLSP